MSESTPASRIGPMSILQLLPVIGESLGTQASVRVLGTAGLSALPDQDDLCDEAPAAAVHQALRREFPDAADDITRRAGEHTGDWILASRMPPVAAMTLARMPVWLAGPILCSLLEKHAWTFAGSGTFRVVSRQPPVFELIDNPVVRGERAEHPLCSWHAAVIERLFRAFVDDRVTCIETACCACGDSACRFEVH